MKKIIVLLLLLFAFTVYGADVKISNLPATTTLEDTDIIPAVYGTTTSKITVANLKTLFGYHAGVTLSTTLGANLLGLSTQQLTLDNQTANYVFAGPTTGEADAPSFRALVAADIPSLVSIYQPLNATLTALAAQTETEGSIQYYTAAATPAVLAIGTAYQVLNTNAGTTAPTWTSTLGATDTRLTAGFFTDLTVTNAIAGAVTGNAGTATALAANPTDCSEGELATAIDASGNLTCGKAIGTDVQAYNSDLTTLAGGGTANCLWGEKSDSSGIECKTTLNLQLDDSAAQFKDATDATKTLQLELGSITTSTKRTLTVPDASGTIALVKTEKLAVFNIPGTADDGTVVDSYVPAAATITGVVVTTSGAACSAVVDIWSQAYADFPPENAQTITASAPPTLTTAQMSKDTTLTGWTTAVAADTVLRANLDSSDCAGNIQVTIYGKQ